MGLYKNRIVVKVGTSTLTNEKGENNLRAFDKLTCVLADMQNLGYEIILVSSGAIAIGANKLKLKSRPRTMRMKQAAAAVGQCSIMYLYDKFFSDYDKTTAQILLNAEDMEIEEKKENLINTFDALLETGIIPVVNENDSVSYTEIESEDRLFGDNDMLSAITAILCRANKLVIFSDIDGFYDGDPRLSENARLIEYVDEIDEHMLSFAGGAGSRRGTGGMLTKLKAAKLASAQGIDTIVTNGKNPSALYDIIEGKSIGTLFKGKKQTEVPHFTAALPLQILFKKFFYFRSGSFFITAVYIYRYFISAFYTHSHNAEKSFCVTAFFSEYKLNFGSVFCRFLYEKSGRACVYSLRIGNCIFKALHINLSFC